MGRKGGPCKETEELQSVCGNHIGRNPRLILAKILCFSALHSHPFPPSLSVHPFLGFHFYSLGDRAGGKGVKKAGGSLCECVCVCIGGRDVDVGAGLRPGLSTIATVLFGLLHPGLLDILPMSV